VRDDPRQEAHRERPGLDLFGPLSKAIWLAAAVFVLLWIVYQIELVLLATLLSLILALALNAPVTWMERKGVSRGLGTVISFAGVVIVVGLVGRLVIPRLADEIPTLIEQVPALVEDLGEQLAAIAGDAPEVRQQLDRLTDWAFGVFEELWRYTDVLLGSAVIVLFVTALVLYMVANMRPLLRWYVASTPPRFREPAIRAFTRSSEMVIGWVVASAVIGAIKAVAVIIFLTLMGIPGAVVWSVVAFFAAFVPRIGFYLMTIPPVVVALGVDPLTALWTLLFYVAFSELFGNFVVPKIFAQTMDINAVFILFMTVAMGYGFGVIGVLLAAPVSGFIKAYYDEFYLARQAPDPALDERVEAMLSRRIEEGKEVAEAG